MQNSHISPQEAATELLKRRAARKSLINFTEYTNPDYQPAGHHHLIAEKLEAVERGEIDRLMIFMPPRHGKSELASRRFPSWYLGRNPKRQIIAASYNSDLASDFGREVRDIVKSPEYHRLFDVSLAEDSRAVNRWHTNQKGVYIAAGVGTAITGRGANCIVEGSKVLTDKGLVSIEHIDISAAPCFVLSYENGKSVYRRVLAHVSREAESYLRIHTRSGRVVEVTGDHRIYTEGGYKPASDIAEGENLLSLVQERGCSNRFRLQEKTQALWKGLLQPFLFNLQQKSTGRSTAENLQAVRSTNGWHADKEVLFRPLQKEAPIKEGGLQVIGYSVRLLQYYFQTAFTQNKVLFGVMQRQGSCLADVREKESWVETWLRPIKKATTFGPGLSNYKAADNRARFWAVCGLWVNEITTRSSHKYERIRQSLDKLGNALRVMPYSASCRRQKDTKIDPVSLVERVHKSVKVYDIQVEGTECFFADGILVHNCALIDDPFKDRQEADSEVTRESVWKWYTSTLRTRLMPNGALILIQTRWHEDDLAGRLLRAQGDRWHVLELPAIANEDTDKEEALWPEWYDLDTLKEIRTDVGQRDWNALFQQRPTTDEGTYFKRDWFKRYHIGEEPETNNYQASDYAVTDSGGDFTEFGVWGVDKDNDLWAKDWWYGQKDASVWIDAQLDQIKQFRTKASFGETGVIRKAIEPFLKKRATQERVFTRFEWITRTRDKASMARAFQGMASMGKVHIPLTDWGDRLINQLVAFPAGEHDDAVDVCALIALALSDAHPAIERTIDEHKPVDRWDKAFKSGVESWKTI